MSAGQFVKDTKGVLDAAKLLRDLLDRKTPPPEPAIAELELAADQQQQGGMTYRAFMFAELAGPSETRARRTEIAENTLATISADLGVANALLAAGAVLGETGDQVEKTLLDQALQELQNTTANLEHGLGQPAAPGRFGFTEEKAFPSPAKSADAPTAIAAFRRRSDEALHLMVREASGAVTSVFDAFKKLGDAKVREGLELLGQQIPVLNRVGRLFRKGIEKLESALAALLGFLGPQALAGIKAKIQELWEKVTKKTALEMALDWTLGVKDVQEDIKAKLLQSGLQPDPLDTATNALAPLTQAFQDNMGFARTCVAGVTLTGAVLAFVPVVGGYAGTAAAVAYALILAAVVLIGLDYTGAHHLLNRVRGVRDIADDIKPA
jgi:hypothetical protein